MEFRLTAHSEQELIQRKIPRKLLLDTLESPQQVTLELFGRKAYQSKLDFGAGKIYLLRAIVDESTKPFTVITAYRTKKIEKYWRDDI
jgi:hypothetical protein